MYCSSGQPVISLSLSGPQARPGRKIVIQQIWLIWWLVNLYILLRQASTCKVTSDKISILVDGGGKTIALRPNIKSCPLNQHDCVAERKCSALRHA